MWSVLKPADWCKERHLGWRFAACELNKQKKCARLHARPAATALTFFLLPARAGDYGRCTSIRSHYLSEAHLAGPVWV